MCVHLHTYAHTHMSMCAHTQQYKTCMELDPGQCVELTVSVHVTSSGGTCLCFHWEQVPDGATEREICVGSWFEGIQSQPIAERAREGKFMLVVVGLVSALCLLKTESGWYRKGGWAIGFKPLSPSDTLPSVSLHLLEGFQQSKTLSGSGQGQFTFKPQQLHF